MWSQTYLHTGGLVQAIFLHVNDLARITIDSPGILAIGVFSLCTKVPIVIQLE